MKLKECSQCGIECYLWKAKPQLCKNCATRKGTNVYNGIKSVVLERNKPIQGDKKRKPINKVSDKQKNINTAYMALREQYLKNHTYCEFKVEWSGRMINCGIPTQDIHHKKGRGKEHVLDSTTWMPICREHHVWIHENDKEARELGYLQSRLEI